jgi:hypothetical protein
MVQDPAGHGAAKPKTEIQYRYNYFDPVRKKRYTSRHFLTSQAAARLVEIGEWVDAKPIMATRIERELSDPDEWWKNSASAHRRRD